MTGMPPEACCEPIKNHIPDIELKIYDNAAHGLYYTAASEVVEDILAHLK